MAHEAGKFLPYEYPVRTRGGSRPVAKFAWFLMAFAVPVALVDTGSGLDAVGRRLLPVNEICVTVLWRQAFAVNFTNTRGGWSVY